MKRVVVTENEASGPNNLQELFNLKRFYFLMKSAGNDAVSPLEGSGLS
jgi:hypothetical protein